MDPMNEHMPDRAGTADSRETSGAATLRAPHTDDSRILARLLKMADGYRAAGSLRQAETMYLDLIRTHPDTPQAQQARDRLLEACEDYERQGKLHHARWLYEQLL